MEPTWTAPFALFHFFVFFLHILLLAVNIRMRLLRNHQLTLPFQWNPYPSPTQPKIMVHQFPLVTFSWWVDPPSSILPSFVPIVVLNIFALSLGRIAFIGQSDCRANVRECPRDCANCNFFHLDHIGPSIYKLRILWGTELAAGAWHRVAKAPLPEVWKSNTNYSNMFSYLFELKLLAHFEILHQHHWNNLHTPYVGRSEYGPRVLVRQRENFVEQI